MKVLRVRNWNKDFESAKSREYNHRSQFYCPNKHGLGYQRILASPNGEAIYGCWQAMCQVLSRQDKPRHGYLTDTAVSTGVPWTAADISLMTRYSEKTCQQMLDLCSSKGVDWLEVTYVTDTERIPQETAKELQSPPTLLYSTHPILDVVASAPVADAPKTKRFEPPTAEAVEEYGRTIGFPICGADFVDYYAARGWKYKGGVAMKDWKAAVRNWKKNAVAQNTPKPPTKPIYDADENLKKALQ